MVALLGGGVVLLIALYVFGTTCDEVCDPRTGKWEDDPDAWQWDAQLVFAIAAVGSAVAGSLFMLADRRDQLGPRLFFSGVGAALLWFAWVSSAY